MFDQLRFLSQDLKRLNIVFLKDIFFVLFEKGVWAVVLYRIGRMLFMVNIPLIKIFLRLIAFFIFKFSELFLGVALRPSTQIGPGFYIGHGGVIRINPAVKAGKNLSIWHLVTIGVRGEGYFGVPAIGDNVSIYAGAKVLGNIKIGNNVEIEANTVVITDIPDNAKAVGVPAKIEKQL